MAVALSLSLSLLISSTQPSFASQSKLSTGESIDVFSTEELLNGGDDSAREVVANSLGNNPDAKSALDERIADSIDPSIVETILSDDQLSTEMPDLVKASADLPQVHRDGVISFPGRSYTGAFSIGPASAKYERTEGVSVVTSTVNSSVVSASHVTDEGGGQIVSIVKDAATSFVDFEYSLPSGHFLKQASDGGAEVTNQDGEVVGVIAAPWAVDADGATVQTLFDFSSNGVIRQHIHPTKDTVFPVAVDPSWTWWTASVLKCAAEIAVTFTPGKVAKVAASLAKIAKKSARARKAVSALGGVKKAAVVVVKKAANDLKKKTKRYKWSKKLPSFKLSRNESLRAGVILSFIGANAWDFFGLGSCGAIVKNLRR